MNRTLTLSLACWAAVGWTALDVAAQTTTRPYPYTMKITPSRPKGSPAETASKDKTRPSTTIYTPCLNNAQDVIAFKLDYDAGKLRAGNDNAARRADLRDVYLFFYNPNALGARADQTGQGNPFSPPCRQDPNNPNSPVVPCDPKVWAVVRSGPTSGGSLALVPLAEVSDINRDQHIYLRASDNLGSGKISEQLLRSYIQFDGAVRGVWSLTGIIASSTATAQSTNTTPVDFADPSTWAAWDTATFMLGAPWVTPAQQSTLTGPICQ